MISRGECEWTWVIREKDWGIRDEHEVTLGRVELSVPRHSQVALLLSEMGGSGVCRM